MSCPLVQMGKREAKAKMRTLAAGSRSYWRLTTITPWSVRGAVSKRGTGGFTLLELLVVIVIMAVATAGVGLALRGSSATQLEREAQRLAALFESARAQSRMNATAVSWRATPSGFTFEGLTGATLPSTWLGDDVRAADSGLVMLGPEPIIRPQQIRLVSISEPENSVRVVTDGVKPFSVQPGVALDTQ